MKQGVVGSDEEKVKINLTVTLLDCKVFCLLPKHVFISSIPKNKAYIDP